MAATREECDRLLRGDFDRAVDCRVVSKEGEVAEAAGLILKKHIATMNEQKDYKNMATNTTLVESEVGMQVKMKRDHFRGARGGKAVMLDVFCSKCNTKVLWYQKDGVGNLLRCYLNRIYAPPELERLQNDPAIREPRDIPNLTCPSCNTVLGTPMRHSDGRLAFRLRPGFVYKKRCKGIGY